MTQLMHNSWRLCMARWRTRTEGCGMQGVVESRTLEDNNGLKYTMVLFSRRSRLHPGMRYIARGLNSLASPGNEIECEQVCRPSPCFSFRCIAQVCIVGHIGMSVLSNLPSVLKSFSTGDECRHAMCEGLQEKVGDGGGCSCCGCCPRALRVPCAGAAMCGGGALCRSGGGWR